MADNVVAKSANPTDISAENQRASVDHNATNPSLSLTDNDPLAETSPAVRHEKEVINLVNGVPRYLLAFGLICSVFCVSASGFRGERRDLQLRKSYK